MAMTLIARLLRAAPCAAVMLMLQRRNKITRLLQLAKSVERMRLNSHGLVVFRVEASVYRKAIEDRIATLTPDELSMRFTEIMVLLFDHADQVTGEAL